ncbi:2'-5' RNA ligase family protein [Arthrobacter sp. USHLN218]|uniref:2'-5' RNA ligase family protein n=1 Tax=Arthrobacter sp. USHLN218 TaxID=3081232 RepID=UPI003017518C
MGAFVVVVFVTPVARGLVFESSRWPLHITLARFDTKEPAADVAQRIGPALARGVGYPVKIGRDDRFGRNGRVRVSLVEPDARLQALHEALLDALGPEVHLLSPHHTRAGFRPHISHTVGRLHPGDTVDVRQACLVDMRPGGDHRHREVLEVWPESGG